MKLINSNSVMNVAVRWPKVTNISWETRLRQTCACVRSKQHMVEYSHCPKWHALLLNNPVLCQTKCRFMLWKTSLLYITLKINFYLNKCQKHLPSGSRPLVRHHPWSLRTMTTLNWPRRHRYNCRVSGADPRCPALEALEVGDDCLLA